VLVLPAVAAGLSLAGLAASQPGRHRARPRVIAAHAVRPAALTARRRTHGRPLRPFQYLVVSFDGSGGTALWPYWLSVARRAGAHFTFFVSAVYLLDEAHRDLYHPPEHSAGSSDIGFAQPHGDVTARQVVRGTLEDIARAYRVGNEIGTHYAGHFCAPYPGSVGEWSAVDWNRELEQVDSLMFDASANNGLRPSFHLPFGPGEIVGARTPCLQGNMRALLPVLAAHGFRYDASGQAVLGTWPWPEDGIWELPLLEIPFVGHTYRVVSMDYNFFANQTIAGTPTADVERQTYLSLWHAFETSYYGNRAPLSFANHFETWDGGAYNRALARVVLKACRMREVRCVSFRELADWLEVQPPFRLRRYRLGRFPHLPHA
jgi:hypothetical protein